MANSSRSSRAKAKPAPAAKALRGLREKTSGLGRAIHRDAYEWIAQQVAQVRAERGMSQKDLATLCGTTQSAIARIESGKRPPRIDTLLTIADALGCDVHVELVSRTS